MKPEQVENRLKSLEVDALVPYTEYVSWMGIEISWEKCPKSKGGNIKRRKIWGKLSYHDMSGKSITREDAKDEILRPFAFRKARIEMIDKKICAICSEESQGATDDWGWLRYLEHGMDICPKCKRKIYEDSYKPWESN